MHLGLPLCGRGVTLLFASKDDILDALFDVLNELFKVVFALKWLY